MTQDNFCPLPWISLETMPNGQVRPCCLYKTPLPDINLKDNTLTEASNANYLKLLRERFKAGEKLKECQKCWDIEDAGGKSKRQYSRDIFPDVHEETKPQIQFLDLKLGNICNLKCRICGSWSSSQWASENIKYGKGFINAEKDILKAGTWPRDNKQFWDDLETLLPNITHLEFTGGEPLLIEEHFDLLKLIVEKDYAKNIKIHYNTNGTTINRDAIQNIWPAFKEVELAFSIDDIKDRFEYQRSGARWELLKSTLVDEIPPHNYIKTQICCSISIFNVYYLDELYDWIKEQNFDTEFYNIIHGPEEVCVTNLTDDVKQKITEKLKGKIAPGMQDAINFMNSKKYDEIYNKKFLEMTEIYDLRRNESYKETFPEMWELLNEKTEE